MRFAAATVLFALLPASTAAAAGCDVPRRAEIRKQATGAIVFRYHGVVRACDTRFGRRVRLAREYVGNHSSLHVREPRIAGSLVGYGEEQYLDGNLDITLVVRSLRTGRTLRQVFAPSIGDLSSPDPTAYDGLTDLALSPSGSLAWIRENPFASASVEVGAADRQGVRKLDAGDDVAKRSLTLRGSTIAWTKGGVRFRAPLR